MNFLRNISLANTFEEEDEPAFADASLNGSRLMHESVSQRTGSLRGTALVSKQ